MILRNDRFGSAMPRREKCGKCIDEAGIAELKSSSDKFGGVGADTCEKSFIGHLAESQAKCESRDLKKSRTMQVGREDVGELGIRHRVGSGEVERAGGSRRIKQVENSGQSIRKRNPAHVLTAVAKLASEPQLEDRKKLPEGASARAEDHSEAEINDANACLASGLGCRLPLLAGVGEKAVAGPGSFVDQLVAAVAIVPNRRGDKEHLRRTFECRKLRRQYPS